VLKLSWPPSRTGSAMLAGVLLVGILVASVGTGYTVSRTQLGDASEYVAKGHVVAHVNAVTGKADAQLADPLATGHQRLETVRLPDGRVAVVNPTTGVAQLLDGTTMTLTGALPPGTPSQKSVPTQKVEVLPAGSHGYFVDPGRKVVSAVDDKGRPGPQVPIPDGIAAAVPGGDSVWLLNAKGDVVEVADGRLKRTVRLAGTARGITVADGHPVVVTDDGIAYAVDEDTPRSLGDTGLHGGDVVLASWRGTGRYVVGVDRATGDVKVLDPRTGDTFVVPLPRPWQQLGAPVMLGDRVYVPDRSVPRLWQVDVARKQVVASLDVPGSKGDDFELKVSGDRVWASSQYDQRLLVVDADGNGRQADKGPGPDVTDSSRQHDTSKPKASTPPPTAAPSTPSPAGSAGPQPGGSSQPPAKLVTIPSFPRGTPQETACAELGQLNLRCEAVPGGDAPGLPTGAVLYTNPAAGKQVVERYRVRVYYVAPLKVPNVVGLRHQKACDTLKPLGCNPTTDPNPTDVPAKLDVVASQNPGAGKDIAKDGTVTVTYPDSIPLPSFAGLGVTEACARVQDVYLMKCAQQSGIPAPRGHQSGEVYDQSPGVGAVARIGSTVTLTFYRGDNDLPDYTGAQPNTACDDINAKGFECRRVEEPYKAADQVMRQDPAPGRYQLGTPVTIHYSRWPLVHYLLYRHGNENVWALRPEGTVLAGYTPQNPVGWAYAVGSDVPGGRVIHGFWCVASASVQCDGWSRNHFYSTIGSYSNSGWLGPDDAAVFLADQNGGCPAPDSHPVWRTWSFQGGVHTYSIDSSPSGSSGNELLGCVF
jgi:beta-lactam-binding protein with PASTA domain